MKKRVSACFCVLLTLVFMLFSFAGCKDGQTKQVVLEQVTDTMVVMKVMEADEGATALSALNGLKEKGEIEFTSLSGVYGAYVTSINGKEETSEATSGYSWMLYTSDAEFSSTEFGSVEYDGKTYGQASLGASSLVVKEGEYYIWSYTYWSF